MFHANLWRTTDGTSNGNLGFNVEYGDCYDMMSACTVGGQNSHFNAVYKRKLDWLTAVNVQEIKDVTDSRVYTIYPQDTPSIDGTTRLLKIDGVTKNYWVEFRQLPTGFPNSMNGALIRWDQDFKDSGEVQLLDMNPQTSAIDDAPLGIGQTFVDSPNGIKITVVGRGNTTPESLKVNVVIECAYSLSPTNVFINQIGTERADTNVTTTRLGCSWKATSNDFWLKVNSGSSGTGNGAVSIIADANFGPRRIGTVTISGPNGENPRTFSVTQASGRCVDSIVTTPSVVPAGGGALNYTHNCNSLTPTSSGTSTWINISTNPITVSPNTGAARSGTLAFNVDDGNGSTYATSVKIDQDGQTASCTYSLGSQSQSFNASAGTGSFSITPTTAGCSSTYTAGSNVSWITISNQTGQTGGNINYTVAQNTDSSVRSGIITLNIQGAANQTFTVSQAAAPPCTFSINPSNKNFSLTGGPGNFALTASNSSCAWSALTSVSWINITSNTSGTGSAAINFTVSASNVPTRTGTITIGGQAFTVNQDSGCVYSLQSTSSAVLSSLGASDSLNLQTGSGCNWTATSNDSWISINPNAFGAGNGTIGYTVAANTLATPRQGMLLVGGQTFTVNQAASKSRKRIRILF